MFHAPQASDAEGCSGFESGMVSSSGDGSGLETEPDVSSDSGFPEISVSGFVSPEVSVSDSVSFGFSVPDSVSFGFSVSGAVAKK